LYEEKRKEGIARAWPNPASTIDNVEKKGDNDRTPLNALRGIFGVCETSKDAHEGSKELQSVLVSIGYSLAG
jgi:hypothetical protein